MTGMEDREATAGLPAEPLNVNLSDFGHLPLASLLDGAPAEVVVPTEVQQAVGDVVLSVNPRFAAAAQQEAERRKALQQAGGEASQQAVTDPALELHLSRRAALFALGVTLDQFQGVQARRPDQGATGNWTVMDRPTAANVVDGIDQNVNKR